MCTVSWRFDKNGYSVFFNRDEQILRPRASLPHVLTLGKTKAILPKDSQGGGTWLAVNEHGITVALLNYYQGRLPKGKLISRGHVVKSCAERRTLAELVSKVKDLKLNKYAPFSLLVFDHNPAKKAEATRVDKVEKKVTMLRWNGRSLDIGLQDSPLISSAVNFEVVYENRVKFYREAVSAHSGDLDDSVFKALHSSHQPSKSSLSICMHRSDARTVSFSHIRVNEKKVAFFYADGAPCETEEQAAVTITRSV